MDLTRPIALRDDVLIIPVGELEDEVRKGIDCSEDDFAVSRPTSRYPSSVIDARAAELLQRFREPRTIVEAVILFSREHGLNAEEVLEDAYHLVRRFLENRFLRFEEGNGEPEEETLLLSRGEDFDGLSVLRPLYMLEDTELYIVSRSDGQRAVLKLLRPDASHLLPLFEREVIVLRHLGGVIAPELLREGTFREHRYLLLEWCPGVDGYSAAAEWIDNWDPNGRMEKLKFAVAIVKAYASLHERGVLHGDIHSRNLLVSGDLAVRLIDFGFARLMTDRVGETEDVLRGGIPFFFEPEYAKAVLEGKAPPPPTPASEQYSLAALLYQMLTSFQYLNFNLEREQMLEQIVNEPPIPFSERGLPEWPELEKCLQRALDKDPAARFTSMAEMADSLEQLLRLMPPVDKGLSEVWLRSALDEAASFILDRTDLDGEWYRTGLQPGPTASLNYGAGGIAYALYRIASLRGDPLLLARADAWAVRASRSELESAYYNDDFELTRENIGEASPYHSRSGVFAVQALIAHSAGDLAGQLAALEGFTSASVSGHKGPDLTLGRSGTILASAFMLDALPEEGPGRNLLLQFGDSFLDALWSELDKMAVISEAGISYPGIAHGWAGFVYATLQWCRATGGVPPPSIEARLHQLADLAEPQGRGLIWPWTLYTQGREAAYMSGWCNGTSGYVFLWTLAHRFFSESHFMDLARGAAWEVWDAPDLAASLCCGLVGRSYALLNFYKRTSETIWLQRARELGLRAAREGQFETTHPHSLYKGELSLAVLAADLECPDFSAQPFFEEEGWPGARN